MVNHLIVAGDVSPEPIVGVQSQSRKADVGVSPIMANSAFLGAFCFAVGTGVTGVTGVTGGGGGMTRLDCGGGRTVQRHIVGGLITTATEATEAAMCAAARVTHRRGDS